MPARLPGRCVTLAAGILAALRAFALDGETGMHDPSTVLPYGGMFYAYGTGNGLPFLVSEDGWQWRRGGNLMTAVPGGR